MPASISWVQFIRLADNAGPRHSAPLADFGFRPHYRYEAWTETEAINGHPNGDMNGFLLGCRLT